MAEPTPEPTPNETKPDGTKQRRWINFVVIALLVYAVVSQIQLIRSNRQLDDISDFVDELKEEREQGEATDPDQLQSVFQAVFASQERINEILVLLCTEFPDDPVCAQG